MFAMDIEMARLLLISAGIALSVMLVILMYRRKKVSVRRNRLADVRLGPLFDTDGEEESPAPREDEAEDMDADMDIAPAPQQEAVQKPAPDNRNVISIHLRARRREGFDGKQLLTALARFDLEYGEMDIFHRKLQVGTQQKVSFSVLNGVEPGTLKREDLESNGTPVIIFFVRLHNSHQPLRSFNEMMDVARQIAYLLDGQLYDDQGSNMTDQTLGYYRSIVREFILQENTRRQQTNGGDP